MLTAPLNNSNIRSFYYDPFNLHPTLAVTGAMAIAMAAFTTGTVAHKLLSKNYNITAADKHNFSIEHLMGNFPIAVQTNGNSEPKSTTVQRQRTASVLLDGLAYF